MKKKDLRSGYTTGACAAAAAKAAVMLLFSAEERKRESVKGVEIPFPDGSRVKFKIHKSDVLTQNSQHTARASVIKDAGDDPDVTHGAEIAAEARLQVAGIRAQESEKIRIVITGGKGVGIVTKPGLPIPIGEPAINPVPRRMIKDAVMEIVEAKNVRTCGLMNVHAIEITISVPDGQELAKKTLNHRLGIVGGISILGTTGSVKPVSTEAWTATIASSMDVAKAMGHKVIVVSAGRSSEKAHMKKFQLPEEAYILMGDHLEYTLKEALQHGFKKIYLCAQWAKMVKIAMATPQTHVKFGAIDVKKAAGFLNSLGSGIPDDTVFNTAREIFDMINTGPHDLTADTFRAVCNAAKQYAEEMSGGIAVTAYLVSYEGEIIAASE